MPQIRDDTRHRHRRRRHRRHHGRRLSRGGRASVTVIDRTGICEETSSGNAAAFAFTDPLPLAHKGMMRQLPKWLADPLGPLSIPPAYLPKLLPWLWRFWRAGADGNYEASLAAQAGLMTLAEAEWMGLMQRSGTRGMLHEDGSLELYESDADFQASLPGWAARDRFGIEYRHVERSELADLSAWPVASASSRHLRARLEDGQRSEGSRQGDLALCRTKGRAFRARRCRAGDAVARSGLRCSSARAHDHGRQLVIAAGAWSHLLAQQFGDRVPLETERGYNTTLPKTAFDVKRQLIFPGHGFVITPLDTGLRVGGAVELGGLQRRPISPAPRRCWRRRSASCRASIPAGGREWMGYRPSLPDSLPVIGRAQDVAERLLCLRPRPSRPDAVRGDRRG